MNWYLVKLVFRIERNTSADSSDFDEQYRLLQARNEEEAFAKSKIIGVKNEQEFENSDGILVKWHFIDTAYIRFIESLSDGVELFSTTVSSEHATEYEDFVHHQAESAFQRITPVAHAVYTD